METTFFQNNSRLYLISHQKPFKPVEINKLSWLLSADPASETKIPGPFVGPRAEMVTPWSTNAVEITQICGISGVVRIEQFHGHNSGDPIDVLQNQIYPDLHQGILDPEGKRKSIESITDIEAYNQSAGLALSKEETLYLESVAKKLGRPLTDSEIFGFAQVNSEHCRHKIFNGTFYIDGKKMSKSLFAWIKATTKAHPGQVLNFYNDNVAFIQGFTGTQFAPEQGTTSSFFKKRKSRFALALKAETHNFPTTVEPFNGAATGAGGEIRDRMAGGKGSFPLAGTACYMTAYPRLQSSFWDSRFKPRPWLYQTPQEILTKASNGASDYGNKFGQPLINGSLLTFEGNCGKDFFAYDKTIMLAGGVGWAHTRDIHKDKPKKGDKIILLGGDNYRIGMGGGAVSSVDTGKFNKQLELNAVQRSNPEMEKRVFNALRALFEAKVNPIVLIHDHGAGGHINCLSELVEHSGGNIQMEALPVGDPTLSDLEMIGNESQERMGMVVKEKDVPMVQAIAERERAPMYVIGTVTGDHQFIFSRKDGNNPVDLQLDMLFGKPPKTIIEAKSETKTLQEVLCRAANFRRDLQNVLRLEHVGCKDWLTNKVDRSVTGKVAQQQCIGPYQLPLQGCGIMAADYETNMGVATAMGHQPLAGLLNPKSGSVLGIAEALTNLMFAPLSHGLDGVTLSANWMWPCKTPGEDARLYRAVSAASLFAQSLGINISTGKDSLSMNQKYPEGIEVRAPGTVIFSAVSPVKIFTRTVTPDLKPVDQSFLIYLNLSGEKENHLGGSALLQTLGEIGKTPPSLRNASHFKSGFDLIQKWVLSKKLLAGQDVSAGGLITAALEMAFSGGVGIHLTRKIKEHPDKTTQFLFCEKPGALVQIEGKYKRSFTAQAKARGLEAMVLGECKPNNPHVHIEIGDLSYKDNISSLRRTWFSPSYYMEQHQAREAEALKRFQNYDKFPLSFQFPNRFSAPGAVQLWSVPTDKAPVAAIIREKGTNGEREMAASLYMAGFRVKDICMTDLISGRENLEDVSFAVFCGGFSNSDVLGSARGWAGAFKYNSKAKAALNNFYKRKDTLSLGVCNGCQLMVLLNLINPKHKEKSAMQRNNSRKFESSFLKVNISKTTKSVLLQNLKGTGLGIWVAHGEGRFHLPKKEEGYDIALKYTSHEYPANPNGSRYNAAGICSPDGRHLAMMPHLERSIYAWQWGYTPHDLPKTSVTPWILAFTSAMDWLKKKKKY